MESRFYGGVSTAEVIPPSGPDLDNVHAAYIEMATSGKVTSTQHTVFDAACMHLLQEERVEAIMLGGADLALVYDEHNEDFPIAIALPYTSTLSFRLQRVSVTQLRARKNEH